MIAHRSRWTTKGWGGSGDAPTRWAILLWALCTIALLAWGVVGPSVAADPQGVAAPCAVGQVKGSVNRLYHAPGSPWYAQTRHARCFDTVTDAIHAGYREAGG